MNDTPAWALHGTNLSVKTITGHDKGILEEATKSTPKYATCIGHLQGIAGVQVLYSKNISSVHMLYSADWLCSLSFKQKPGYSSCIQV